MFRSCLFSLLCLFLAAGCTSHAVPIRTASPIVFSALPTTTPEQSRTARVTETVTETVTAAVTSTPSPSTTHEPVHTPAPSLTSTPGPSGPVTYPPEINPLSGLPVQQPQNLRLPPALLSVSNSPVSTRPQAGLSFSPLVFEMYIGEGATRFLALFYGDLPAAQDGEDAAVGPIRSGRIPYETLRTIYNGFLMFAGASWRVLPFLEEFELVLNQQPESINGAHVPISRMMELAQEKQVRLGEPAFSGLRFDPTPPENGKPGQNLWMAFHYNAQVFWRYDAQHGAYLRYQDQGEGTELQVFSDRLNDEELAFENVVVLYCDYHRYDELYFDIDLLYIKRYPALLFRDGQVHEIYWTTRNEEPEWTTGKLRPIRFVDYEGNPVALKPGQTWVELVQLHSPTYETLDTTDYWQLSHNWERGSGNWAVLFSLPAFEASPTPPR